MFPSLKEFEPRDLGCFGIWSFSAPALDHERRNGIERTLASPHKLTGQFPAGISEKFALDSFTL
ncbi:MAG: hypothetical protein DME22_25910 [Verrucomicrobia bacterium]|nr:MAG: hypothetical protein DME22_25910 [Verrucomicrobiota bacterium]